VPRAVIGTALLGTVCALTGMGIGALIRHAATTVVTVSALLLLVPTFLATYHYHWQADLDHAQPLDAWHRLHDISPDSVLTRFAYPPTLQAAWTVYLLWPLVGAAIAVIVMDRRDA
jgi:hypothetical protein